MKKTIIISALLLIGCNVKKKEKDLSEFPYKIEGWVELNNKKHEAIWYTDTFYFETDTVCYDNSDGSIVRIAPPYVIKKNE